MNQTDTDKIAIERMLDYYGTGTFFEFVAEICREKAEHVETNWQDRRMAKAWRRLGVRLEDPKMLGGRL